MRTVFQRAHRDGKNTATKADKHHAELRSEQATSRWRTALRDYKIIRNDDSSWAGFHRPNGLEPMLRDKIPQAHGRGIPRRGSSRGGDRCKSRFLIGLSYL